MTFGVHTVSSVRISDDGEPNFKDINFSNFNALTIGIVKTFFFPSLIRRIIYTRESVLISGWFFIFFFFSLISSYVMFVTTHFVQCGGGSLKRRGDDGPAPEISFASFPLPPFVHPVPLLQIVTTFNGNFSYKQYIICSAFFCDINMKFTVQNIIIILCTCVHEMFVCVSLDKCARTNVYVYRNVYNELYTYYINT